MNRRVNFKDLGLIDYKKAWDYQEELLNSIVQEKIAGREGAGQGKEPDAGFLLFCEHPHVYTLGKSGTESNLLIREKQLREKGAAFYKIDRGGDITYHGPGQIVGYPILDLEMLGMGVKKYIFSLEEAIIQTLKEYHLRAGRMEGATGVWLDQKLPDKARKICAIGVRVSRAVTMHGFAFNVQTDLDYFNYINPCGFVDKGVTSLSKELGYPVPVSEVKIILKQKLTGILGVRPVHNKSEYE